MRDGVKEVIGGRVVRVVRARVAMRLRLLIFEKRVIFDCL